MTSLMERVRAFTGDHLLRRVVRNSTYLFASNFISAILSIVTANALGVKSFGELQIVMIFVSSVNRLLSFRMGDVVVKYVGEALEKGDTLRAGAVVKAAGLAEGITSLLTYGVLALLAPLGVKYFVKDTPLPYAFLIAMFLIYGVSILSNITTETATGVLQVTGHYRSQALITLVQSLVSAALLAWVVIRGGSQMDLIWGVMWAYLGGKIVAGLGPIFVAFYWLPRRVGKEWWRASFHLLPPWRELISFSLNTNFSATINMVARDGEPLWLGYFFNPTVVGYYKTAQSIVLMIVMPINPFISTTYPEITRAFVARQWLRLRNLLRRVTFIAAGWTGVVALGLLLIGKPVLFTGVHLFGRTWALYFRDPGYLPAYDVLLVLLIGYSAANILFWNRPLLLAQGAANYAFKVSFWAMLVKVALTLILLPGAGYMAEAWLLTGYLAVSVGLMTWKGLVNARAAETSLAEPV